MESHGIDSIALKEYIEVFAGWPQIISVAVLLAIIIASIIVIVRQRREDAEKRKALKAQANYCQRQSKW